MYSPVRRCQKNELSESFASPTAHPATPNRAVNTQSRPSRGVRNVGAVTASGLTASGDRARSSMDTVVMMSERARDADHGRPEDDHEDRREDAEHEREQHLHRR